MILDQKIRGSQSKVWERARGASSLPWLHSLVIFIEWMAASKVPVFVGRQLLLLKSFLPFALCATLLLSFIPLLGYAVSDSCWASLYRFRYSWASLYDAIALPIPLKSPVSSSDVFLLLFLLFRRPLSSTLLSEQVQVYRSPILCDSDWPVTVYQVLPSIAGPKPMPAP